MMTRHRINEERNTYMFHRSRESYVGPVRLEEFEKIQMVLDESVGICEKKILFRIKKETDQARFKDTRTGPTTTTKKTRKL